MPTATHQPSHLSTASARLATAKAAFTVAAQAAVNGDAGADRMATDALAELNQAQRKLRELTGELFNANAQDSSRPSFTR